MCCSALDRFRLDTYQRNLECVQNIIVKHALNLVHCRGNVCKFARTKQYCSVKVHVTRMDGAYAYV